MMPVELVRAGRVSRVLVLMAGSLCAAGAMAGGAGCQTEPRPAPNYGRTHQQPLDDRMSSESGLSSKDLTTATDEMVRSIASKPEFIDSEFRNIIVMDRVINKTAMTSQNFDIYLARIRAHLNESGARYNIGFVQNKAAVEELRRKEGLDPVGTTTFKSKADYALQGTFYDLNTNASNTYLLTFQIIDMRDGEIVWEGSYEVKFA